jgi:hypothetical protein
MKRPKAHSQLQAFKPWRKGKLESESAHCQPLKSFSEQPPFEFHVTADKENVQCENNLLHDPKSFEVRIIKGLHDVDVKPTRDTFLVIWNFGIYKHNTILIIVIRLTQKAQTSPDGLIALMKPSQNSVRTLKYIHHEWDLNLLLAIVLLIEAQSIIPKPPRVELLS